MPEFTHGEAVLKVIPMSGGEFRVKGFRPKLGRADIVLSRELVLILADLIISTVDDPISSPAAQQKIRSLQSKFHLTEDEAIDRFELLGE